CGGHRAYEGERATGGRVRLAQDGELLHRRTADLVALLLHSLERSNGAAAEPSFDEVDAPALETRVRRTKEREQLGAIAPKPGEPEQREQRGPERRLTEPQPLLHRNRQTEGGEHGVERCTPSFDGVADNGDRLRVGAGADQRNDLLRDELER